MRASLNGRDFIGMFARDSIVAMWHGSVGQLQIHGAERNSGTVRLILRCGALPKAGIYAIGAISSPASAHAVMKPTLWQRIWPLRGTRSRAFLSDSSAPGTLVLDTVDSAKAIVKGHFKMVLRSVDRTPAETLSVDGTFFGRLYIGQPFPERKMRWAPGMRTDCERIRDAVSM
jgi:hypothetical protein